WAIELFRSWVADEFSPVGLDGGNECGDVEVLWIGDAEAQSMTAHSPTSSAATSKRWCHSSPPGYTGPREAGDGSPPFPMEGDGGSVAVMIEPARAADLTPILLDAYGLTEREIDIVIHLARGLRDQSHLRQDRL